MTPSQFSAKAEKAVARAFEQCDSFGTHFLDVEFVSVSVTSGSAPALVEEPITQSGDAPLSTSAPKFDEVESDSQSYVAADSMLDSVPSAGVRRYYNGVVRNEKCSDLKKLWKDEENKLQPDGSYLPNWLTLESHVVLGLEKRQRPGNETGGGYRLFTSVSRDFYLPRRIDPLNATHEEHTNAIGDWDNLCDSIWYARLRVYFSTLVHSVKLLSVSVWTGAIASVVVLRLASRLSNIFALPFGYQTRVLTIREKKIIASTLWFSTWAIVIGLVGGVFDVQFLPAQHFSMTNQLGNMLRRLLVCLKCFLLVTSSYVVATYGSVPRHPLGLKGFPLEAILINPRATNTLWDSM